MPTTRIPTYPADVVYETALNAGPLQASPPPWWTNITPRVLGRWSTARGASYMLARTTAGTWQPVLDNRDGGLDPGNSAGPYYPNLAPYKGLRIRMPMGVNQLTVDQASAGEQTGYLGAIPAQMNVVNDFGYPLTIAASGSAYQGSQVYQAVLPGGATQFATILLVKNVPVIPRAPYSFSAQVRITSGNSVSTNLALLWFDANGNALTPQSGAAQTVTSGSSTWVGLSVSATSAPAGAYSAQLKVQIASGTLSGSTTWQLDGLQLEQSPVASPWQMPATLGANLLPQTIAGGLTLLDPTKDAAGNYFQTTGSIASTLARVTNLTAAPTGHTTAVAWTVPSSGGSNQAQLADGVNNAAATGPVQDCVQVAGSVTYTASRYLSRASSADVTLQAVLRITWYDITGATISTAGSSNTTVPVGSWVRATVSAAAPANAVWGRCSIYVSSAPTATNTIYSTALQFEQAASAGTWVDPGPTYFAWWGAWEQFPQRWRLSGTWGETDAVGTDALAGLAQYTLGQPLVQEILALSPNFLYTLDDPAGALSCTDKAGKRVPAPVENAPGGQGSLTFGNAVTAASPTGTMQGSAGPVATFNNDPTGSGQSVQLAETFVSIHKTTTAPGPPPNGAWTRLIHFRAGAAPASGAAYALWEALPQTALLPENGSLVSFAVFAGGILAMSVQGVTGTFVEYNGAADICDGDWHQLAVACDSSGNVTMYVDGAAVVPNLNGGNTVATLPISGITSDVLGTSVQIGAGYYRAGHVGDMAIAAELPFAASAAQVANLYGSFRSASAGESSGARAKRLAVWVGYNGPTAIDAGLTQTMGPASDLAGQSALNAFNAIAATENGDGYVSAAAALTFKSRSARYNSAPVFVFGEGAPIGHVGEWPAEDVQFSTDPMNTYNIIPTQQYSTGQLAIAQDAASQQANWPRTAPTIVINSTSFAEVQAAGQYQLGRLKTPRMRLASMTLHPAAVPGLWRVCAQLEKGTRIRVFKRPPWRAVSSPIQFDGFVERVEWNLDSVSGDATVRVEASPADLASYWVLAALHTTLNTQASSGQNQASINALPDAYVNTLSQSLPQGYQLTFEPGTARQETMTLSPTGIPFTGIGYQSATLTFTSNFGFTHPAGSTVCEPMPGGYTDPATWDAASVLGAASAVVVSGGGAGTNTITLGPLGDSAVNAAGSNWAAGDLLWISPNNPATFEGYNRLHPNVATAGEGALPLPTATFGYTVGLFSAYSGNALQVTASGTAWQGGQVWQVTVPGAATTGQDLVSALKLPCAPNLPFTGSMYVRCATSSRTPQVQPYIQWYDAYYNPVGSTTTGTTVTLTGSPSAAWTRVTVAATAPAGAVFGRIGVTLTSAPASSWAFQADGLQFEQANAASVFCVTPQVKSVAVTAPGYGQVAVTLNTNLINTHAAGDIVCDPLPPGVTSPTAVAATARLAY